MARETFLRLEWGLSLGLVASSLLWASFRGIALTPLLVPTATGVVGGVLVGAALWIWIPLLRSAPDMARVWRTLLVPLSQALHRRDLVVVALLSGFSEELFFRGIALPELGLVASSLLFGLLHALNPIYAAWATVTGAIFGILATQLGTLIAPMTAHAVYNLGALLVLRHSAPVEERERALSSDT